MDHDAMARRFWSEGYLVLDDFFDPRLMDQLNALIMGHFGNSPEYLHDMEYVRRSRAEVIPWFPQREGVSDFTAVDDDPRLQRLTAAVLGEGWQEMFCMVMFSRKGTIGQPWHQDCPPEHPAAFNLNRLVYTHDIDERSGGQTVVVPGSHRHGPVPVGDPVGELPGTLVLRPAKGTLVLLHGHTWHRVQPVLGSHRVSTNFRSVPQGVSEGVTDVCVYRNMRYRFSTREVVEERVPS
jgi:ectoine hydroxylase